MSTSTEINMNSDDDSEDLNDLIDNEVEDNQEDNSEILNDAEDINVPKLDQNMLNQMVNQIKNMNPTQRNVFLQSLLKNKNINPNKKEFSSMSRRDYQKMKLRKN